MKGQLFRLLLARACLLDAGFLVEQISWRLSCRWLLVQLCFHAEYFNTLAGWPGGQPQTRGSAPLEGLDQFEYLKQFEYLEQFEY